MIQNLNTIKQLAEILRNHIGQINAEDLSGCEVNYQVYCYSIDIDSIDTNGMIAAVLQSIDNDDEKNLIDLIDCCLYDINKHADEQQAYIRKFKFLGDWDECSWWKLTGIEYVSDGGYLNLWLSEEPVSDYGVPLFDDEFMTEVMYKVRKGLEGLKIQTDNDGDTYVVFNMTDVLNDDEIKYFRYAFDYASESDTDQLGCSSLTADREYEPGSLPLCGCRFGQHDEYIVDLHKTCWSNFAYEGKLYVKLPDEDDAEYGKAVISI